MRYLSTIERQSLEQGIEQGIEQGQRSLIVHLLTRQVGELPESTLAQVNQLSVGALEALAEALLEFDQLPDLEQWLQQAPPANPTLDPDHEPA